MRQSISQLTSFSYGLSGSVLLLSGVLLGGCSGTVEVGDPGTGGAVGGDGDNPAASGGSGGGDNVGGGGNAGGGGGPSGEAGSSGVAGGGGNAGGGGGPSGEAGSSGVAGGGGNAGGGGGPSGEAGSSGVAGGSNCTIEEANEAARSDEFEAWLGMENEWGELTGTFQGYIEGGPDLTLAIDSEGGAVLIVGVPAASPVKDEGYLCEGECVGIQSELREGGTYPIHGAAFAADRLTLSLAPFSPFQPWCALQTPVFVPEEGACYYDLRANAPIASGETCSIGNEVVDCDWFHLVELRPCRCTAEECFASVSTESDGMKIDVGYDAAAQSLQGNFIVGDTARPLHLFKD